MTDLDTTDAGHDTFNTCLSSLHVYRVNNAVDCVDVVRFGRCLILAQIVSTWRPGHKLTVHKRAIGMIDSCVRDSSALIGCFRSHAVRPLEALQGNRVGRVIFFK